MSEDDDFIWLLRVLKTCSKDFGLLYGVEINIADIIFLKDKIPSCWFYMTPDKKLKSREDDWLKIKIVQEYFHNPNITIAEVKEMGEVLFPQVDKQKKDQLAIEDAAKQDPLFYFYSTIKTKKGVIRMAQEHVTDELFNNQDYCEMIKSWSKIISWKPINQTKQPQLFTCTYEMISREVDQEGEASKDLISKMHSKITIERKNVEVHKLKREEFTKKEQPNKSLIRLDDHQYKSLSQFANEKCTSLLTAIVRMIESKFDYRIFKCQIECFLTTNGQLWLMNSSQILFMDETGEQLHNVEKPTLMRKPHEKFIPYQCPGIYCDCANNNVFFDENDESFSLFMMQNEEEMKRKKQKTQAPKDGPPSPTVQSKSDFFYVQRKAIFLDVVERYKTQLNLDKFHINKNQMTENLLFKTRIYYSLSEVLVDRNFKHLKIDNFYEKVRVCRFCYSMYTKLDHIRIRQLKRSKKPVIDQKFVQQAIEKLVNPQGIMSGTMMPDKEGQAKFSKKFYKKLVEFDIEKEKFEANYELRKSVDEGFYSRKYQPVHEANFFATSQGTLNKKDKNEDNSKNFQLPKITMATLTDKDKMLKRKEFYVSKSDAESLGLKHYLGHTKNLPYSDCGLAISKSSLALNNLQDKIQEVQKVKEKMEREKIAKIKQEIDLMMCPYMGGGKRDYSRLKEFVSELQNREGVELAQGPEGQIIQVVTDKNEFLTEGQRKQKQDKEKKEREIQQTKKNFLETNSQLADSILIRHRESQQKSNYSNQHRNRFQEPIESGLSSINDEN